MQLHMIMGTIKFAAFEGFEGFFEQPGSFEAMSISDCADTVHNLPPSMVEHFSCSDYWRTDLRFDAAGDPYEAASYDTVEPYFLPYKDCSSISYDELPTISPPRHVRSRHIAGLALVYRRGLRAIQARPTYFHKQGRTQTAPHFCFPAMATEEWLEIVPQSRPNCRARSDCTSHCEAGTECP